MKLGYVRRWLAACALAAAFVGPVLADEPSTIKDRVVGVADGNTIKVLDHDKRQHKIRFDGIDAPVKGQASGFRSKENLAKLIYDRNALAECGKRNRPGREVRNVFDGSREEGLEQIRAGYAWWYRAYSNERSPDDRNRYEIAEHDARAERLALWRDPKPVPLREWQRER
jgi:endonuclease YncB( thermonuclease family)